MVSEFGDPFALSASIADEIGPRKVLLKPLVPPAVSFPERPTLIMDAQ